MWAGVGLVRFQRGSGEAPRATVVQAEPEQAKVDQMPAKPQVDARDDEPDDSGEAREEPPEPEPEPEPETDPGGALELAQPSHNPQWADGLDLPKQVKYTIRFGGSLRRVANLFKIFHHEIAALNPGIDLDRELPPNTKVVVYRADEGTTSESIDFPGSGKLSGAAPMMEGRGRILKATPWKRWATVQTIAVLDRALDAWHKRPGAQDVLVGNLSAREGGRLKPHSTHQSGRDVDLGYIQKWDGKEELNWRKMGSHNLDAGETWALLQTLVNTGAVEVVFIDSKLQKLLFDYAKEKGVSEERLAAWLEYPRRPGTVEDVMVQHVAGHDDHLHVRFSCPPDQKRCRSRSR